MMIIELGFFGNFLSLSCTGPSTTQPSKTTSLLPLNKALQGQSTRPVLIKTRFSYFFYAQKLPLLFSKIAIKLYISVFVIVKPEGTENNNFLAKVKLCNSNALIICKN